MCFHDGKPGGCLSRPDRSCANVPTLRSTGRVNAARAAFAALTPEERTDLLLDYCKFCGGPAGCTCMRDE